MLGFFKKVKKDMADTNVVQESRDLYGIDDWGGGYFGISSSGSVAVHPFGKEQTHALELDKILTKATELNVKTPLLLRFPQILENQLHRLYQSFQICNR